MNEGSRDQGSARVLEVLHGRMKDSQSCDDAVAAFEEVTQTVWALMAQMMGDVGARAVMGRAVELSGRRSPLVRRVAVAERGVDFAAFRLQALESGCRTGEVEEALILLGTTVFQTLSDLTGDVLTTPLLRSLESRLPNQGVEG